ncbi:hypothetical protein H5410_014268 [Solanum commersonii]|uniref:Uncharacterized protein n=1 Tax=Solanum commersonii TaxID=4109 RepID=A0A9J5ZQW1_SOLCO|nr:hypothetical protein H5410_014268 [Solanum commersonii]
MKEMRDIFKRRCHGVCYFVNDIILMDETRDEVNDIDTTHVTYVKVRIDTQAISNKRSFKYCGLIIQENEEIGNDCAHHIEAEWMRWRLTSDVLCDIKNMLSKLKDKFYNVVMRPAICIGGSVASQKSARPEDERREMRILRYWVGVAYVVDKMRKVRLRWLKHVKRRCTNVLVRRSEKSTMVGMKRSKGITPSPYQAHDPSKRIWRSSIRWSSANGLVHGFRHYKEALRCCSPHKVHKGHSALQDITLLLGRQKYYYTCSFNGKRQPSLDDDKEYGWS